MGKKMAFKQDRSGLWHFSDGEFTLAKSVEKALANRPAGGVCWFWFNGVPAPMYVSDDKEDLELRYLEWRTFYLNGTPQERKSTNAKLESFCRLVLEATRRSQVDWQPKGHCLAATISNVEVRCCERPSYSVAVLISDSPVYSEHGEFAETLYRSAQDSALGISGVVDHATSGLIAILNGEQE